MKNPAEAIGADQGSETHYAELIDPLARLVMTAGQEFSVDDMLRDLCRGAVDAIGVAGGGVMGVGAERLHFVYADEPFVTVERLQEELQEGPCCDSILSQEPVVVDDIAAESQWPAFVAESKRAEVGAMVAMPLLARGRSWGVLDLYRTTRWSWTDRDLAAARLFADVAASYIAMAADRDSARVNRLELEHRATHDELTGLPTRTLLFDRVEHALATAERRHTCVAVLLIDVDQFKKVNDSLGHAVGDVVLGELAGRIRSVLRDSDTLARLSGDEFVAVCEDLGGTPADIEVQLNALTRRIHDALQAPISAGADEVVVSVSMGAAVTDRRHTPRELIDEADQAMYLAKQQGTGMFVLGDAVSPDAAANYHLPFPRRDEPAVLAARSEAATGSDRAARAYSGAAHGRSWTLEGDQSPARVVDLGAGAADMMYRLVLQAGSDQPVRDHRGNYLYVPLQHDLGSTA